MKDGNREKGTREKYLDSKKLFCNWFSSFYSREMLDSMLFELFVFSNNLILLKWNDIKFSVLISNNFRGNLFQNKWTSIWIPVFSFSFMSFISFPSSRNNDFFVHCLENYDKDVFIIVSFFLIGTEFRLNIIFSFSISEEINGY